MNHTELLAVGDELKGLEGQFLTGVWQVRRDRVVLGLGDTYLLLVPRGADARVHLVGRRPASPKKPFSFQGACRAHLRGRLLGVDIDPADRILDLSFTSGSLHLRLTGSRGGLWLLDGERAVAAYDGPSPSALPELPVPPAAPPTAREPRFAPADGETWNEAAERWFGDRERQRSTEDRRRELRRRLNSRIARDRRLVEALHRDLAKAEGADQARNVADALASALHTLTRGATTVIVPDPLDPESSHTIAVDPKRSPGQNLEKLYARARRLERMGDRVLEHLEEVEARLRTLVAARAVVDDAEPALLDRLATLVSEPPQRRAPATAPALPWWTWRTPRGQEVLVGKNAQGNRRLTFQKARATDWWMHLRGRPGAHVVIRCNRGQSPDLQTLLGAAELIGRYARIEEGSRYEVQLARTRDVRSIPGAADGRVLVHQERVIEVTRDPSQVVGWTEADASPLDLQALNEALDG